MVPKLIDLGHLFFVYSDTRPSLFRLSSTAWTLGAKVRDVSAGGSKPLCPTRSKREAPRFRSWRLFAVLGAVSGRAVSWLRAFSVMQVAAGAGREATQLRRPSRARPVVCRRRSGSLTGEGGVCWRSALAGALRIGGGLASYALMVAVPYRSAPLRDAGHGPGVRANQRSCVVQRRGSWHRIPES